MRYYLGIDIGTSSVKTVLIDDESFRPVAYGRACYGMSTTGDGWVEQSPLDWWHATINAVRDVLKVSATPPERVAGIGLSGQMHTLVALDRRGEPVRAAISWADQRSVAQCRQIEERFGSEELTRLTGLVAATGFTLPKLLWVMENEPESAGRMEKILLPKDYVRLRLTGTCFTDETDASGTLMFDIRQRRWAQPILETFQVSESLLPSVLKPTDVAGYLEPQAATATGLKAGIPVVAGAGDAESAAIALGVVKPGSVSITVGTGGQVLAPLNAPLIDPQGRVHTLCHAAPGTWHLMGAILAAGLSVRWLENLFSRLPTQGHSEGGGVGVDLEQLLQEASEVPAGSGGVVFLPYLIGERSPHMDPFARGVFFGLEAWHERGHLARAVVEGVCFALRDSIEIFRELGVTVDSLVLSGGVSHSLLFQQTIADVSGVPALIVDSEEQSALGAALLALAGCNDYDIRSVATRAARTKNVVEPISLNASILEERYHVFRALYTHLRGMFRSSAHADSLRETNKKKEELGNR